MRTAVKASVLALLVAAPSVLFAQDLPPLGTPSAPPADLPSEATPPPEQPADPASPETTSPQTSSTEAASPGTTPAPATTTDASGADASAAASTTNKPADEAAERDPRRVSPGLNTEGTVGMQRMSAAWGGKPMTFQLALMGEVFSGNNAIRLNDQNTLFIGDLLFNASLSKYFSANLRLQTRNNVNSYGRPEAMLSQGDLLLGVKGSVPLTPGLWLGGDFTLGFPTNFGGAGPRFSGTSIRPRLLFSFDGSELDSDIPLKGHFNLGYRIDNSANLIPDGTDVTRVERFAYGLSAYDFVEIGLGFMVDLPYVSPFLAWNLHAPVAAEDGACGQPSLPCVADAGFASFPNVISLGAKAEPVENLGLHLGFDFGLTGEDAYGLPVTPPYMVVFGASWTIDPTPKVEYVEVASDAEATPQRYIVGTVVDAETREPLRNVIIRYGGTETPQATDENGEFRSYGFLPASALALSFEHPDYEKRAINVTLETGEGEQEATIELTSVVKQGVIRGRVTDEAGNPVPNARVKVSGDAVYEPLASSDGTFEERVDAGNYTVAVSAANYLTRGKDVTVAPDGSLDVDIVLKPAPTESSVALRADKIEISDKVFFETGKAVILPQSFGLLDQVASLLSENPQIRLIQIEGHTDDTGADEVNMTLSQERAEAVRAYMMEAGISGERLSAKGFGETRPVLPNTSDRNRRFNRRVEFNIVNQ